MEVVEFVDEMFMYSVFMVDLVGNIQCILFFKDFNMDKEGGNKLYDNFFFVNVVIFENGCYKGGLVVFVVICGQIVGLVYKIYCIFMLVVSFIVIGVIFFENDVFCFGVDSILLYVIGSMFIILDNICIFKFGEKYSMIDVKFFVWSDRGFFVIYKILYVGEIFIFEVIFKIFFIFCFVDVKLLIYFVLLSNYFFRVELVCFYDEEFFLWRFYIIIWLLYQLRDDYENFSKCCRLFGEGDLFVDWVYDFSNIFKYEVFVYVLIKEFIIRDNVLLLIDNVLGQEDIVILCKDDLKYIFVQIGRIVILIMVIL